MPGLFSPEGFNTAFSGYQQHLVDNLNDSTQGSKYANQDVKSLAIECARDPTQAYLFNLASMAFNNHFFFRGINTNPDVVSTPPSDLAIMIKRDFGSMDTLRSTFLATAEAMFGPGFVWLVQLTPGTGDSAYVALGALIILLMAIFPRGLAGICLWLLERARRPSQAPPPAPREPARGGAAEGVAG